MKFIVQTIKPPNADWEEEFIGPFDSKDAADAWMGSSLDKPPYAVYEMKSLEEAAEG